MSGDVEALAEILKAHRVEQLGPWAVKCHVCDDWTEGTIHHHHAELARAFFAAERDRAVREALAPVRALAEEWERLRADDTLAYASRYIADLRAALPDDREGGAS